MKTRNNAGQASRLSHFSNQSFKRKPVLRTMETGATPVPLRLTLLGFTLLLSAFCFRVSGQSYSIDWYNISGGGGTSTNGPYAVTGTIGQPDASGALSGGSYSVTGGFWSLIALQTPGAPTLTITINHQLSTITVAWPYPSTGWTLQQNANLTLVNGWTSSGGVSNDGVNNFITVYPPTGNLFFRLQQP